MNAAHAIHDNAEGIKAELTRLRDLAAGSGQGGRARAYSLAITKLEEAMLWAERGDQL